MRSPTVVIGGVIGLWIFGHSLNIYSMIGLVRLIGLVAEEAQSVGALARRLRDVHAQAGVEVEVHVRHEHEGEEADQVALPAVDQILGRRLCQSVLAWY